MNSQKGNGAVFVLVTIAIIGVFTGMILMVDSEAALKAEAENAVQESNSINDKLRDSVPVPQLQTSSERKNVAKRAEIFNNEEKISYIYLVNYGKVMAFFTVQGKVSSLRSYMTPVDRVINSKGENCTDVWGGCSQGYGYVVEAPDIDGTYGENVDGIFFFTTEGAYVEWRGDYMMSDQPLRLATPPELVRNIE